MPQTNTPKTYRANSMPLYNTFHEVWRFAKVLTEQRESPVSNLLDEL